MRCKNPFLPDKSSPSGDMRTLLPVLSVIAGIATFSAMDAAIKGAALAVGVYTALLGRNLMGTALALPLWLAAGQTRPTRRNLVIHLQRAILTAAMASLFFYGLVRIPMAEGIALSFISPIIALYFAALWLGERIRPRAIAGSLLGIAGVIVIASAQLGGPRASDETLRGTLAIAGSSVFYAMNLVLQRKQAQMARPIEIALFQNAFLALIFLCFSPWLLVWPDGHSAWGMLAGAVLATLALLFLSWGYARAEAQVLLPIEYTGFLWAALFGWLLFGEHVSIFTLAGTALILLGVWVAVRRPKGQTAPEQIHCEHPAS